LCHREFQWGSFKVIGDESVLACLDCAVPLGSVKCRHHDEDGNSWLEFTAQQEMQYADVEIHGDELIVGKGHCVDYSWFKLECTRCHHQLPVPPMLVIKTEAF
jgi:hypothetical protein